jgi:MFS family permease
MTRISLMRTYLDFLRTPYAVRLLGGTLLGRLPNGMAGLVILLFVRAHGGDYTLGGALAAGYVVAMAVGQPVLGRLMDRAGQRRVLIPAAVAAAAGFTLPAVTGLHPLPVTTGAILLAGFATPPLEAGLRALWPVVLKDPAQVAVAYGLDAAAQELLFICGPLLVIAAAVISPEAALLLTALLGVAGTLVVVSSVPSRDWRGRPRTADWAGPLRSPGLRTMLAALACAATALGVIGVAAVTYAENRHSSTASGLLLAANAGGAFAGGLVYAARRPSGPAHRRLPWLVGGLALGYLPLSLAPALPLMLVLAMVGGVFLAPVLACTFTLVDELAPQGTVTEAFAWVVTAMAGGAALGSAVAGRAGDLSGPSGAFACAGAGGVLALAVLLVGRRGLRGPDGPAETPADDADDADDSVSQVV